VWSIATADALERVGPLWMKRSPGKSWEVLDAEFGGTRVAYRRGEGWTDLADPDGGQQGGCPGDESDGEALAVVVGCGNEGISILSAPGLVFYDDHGRWRATLLQNDAEAERVTPTVRGEVLEVRGAGCSLDVPLAEPRDAGGVGRRRAP
jgi:hypothetical protein